MAETGPGSESNITVRAQVMQMVQTTNTVVFGGFVSKLRGFVSIIISLFSGLFTITDIISNIAISDREEMG